MPQFQSDALAASLAQPRHRLPLDRGARRPSSKRSVVVDSAWRHPAFRAYADHVLTEAFAEGLFELTMLAFGTCTAIMCAEVLWWRCHRRLIADVLTSLDVRVDHILDSKKVETHKIAPPARIVGGALSYVPQGVRDYGLRGKGLIPDP